MFKRASWIIALALCALWWHDVRAQIPDNAWKFRRIHVAIAQSEWGLNPPLATLAAQIHQESGWNCEARSRAGALGCAQFMPSTAVWIGDVREDLRSGNLYDPVWSFQAQVVYMKWLSERIGVADRCQRIAFALQAYNGGLGWVRKRRALSDHPDVCLDYTCNINPGILPSNQAEAGNYPERIIRVIEPRYIREGWGDPLC